VPGGFGIFLSTYAAMEGVGDVRCGYFVEGLSGAQFSHGRAVDLLRDSDGGANLPNENRSVMPLAAFDPANPYGALLPWPEVPITDGSSSKSPRPRRTARATVVLWRGELALYADAGGKQVLVFARHEHGEAMGATIDALARAARGPDRRSHRIETINGIIACESPH
jgi:ATP-dependent Lhr-like helicase